jgi:hypothetical protein
MPASLLQVFQTLASFDPPKGSLADAPWEAYTDWAIGQGLAPLAAYNLEYRLGSKTGAPEWVRDRLLSIYQGSVNDNVMKLVNFKRAVDELEGREVLMLGGGSFAESLYPHVAFRPVIDIRLLVPKADLEGFTGYLRRAEFKPTHAPGEGPTELSDGRTSLFVHGELLTGDGHDAALFARAHPMKVYGPSLRRLDLEDAILTHVLLMSRAGFDVPIIEFVDLRELIQGAPSTGGVYSHPVDSNAVRTRAAQWHMERALWAALQIVERLFPETAGVVSTMQPSLMRPTRELLERLVVAPVANVGRTHQFRGEDALRTLLAGG